MKKIMLNGVDGNFGSKAAEILLERWPHEDLIFAAPTEKGLQKYAALGIETRVADFNDPQKLTETFKGADTIILISMPFVGPKRRKAHQTAIDSVVASGAKKLVYTSVVGAGDENIDTYEVNDHVWTEAYIRQQPIHYLILRDSQYAEAMISSFLNAYETTGGVLSNNMGEGRMAFVSRNDCACAAAFAAMSDWEDRIIDVNGAQLLTIGEFVDIGSQVTGKHVTYHYVNDEEQYEYFDSIGVPRTTEGLWADSAKAFPFCSDGMVTFGRALRNGQMSVFTDDFEKLTGRKPVSVREMFEHIDEYLVGNRTSTDS